MIMTVPRMTLLSLFLLTPVLVMGEHAYTNRLASEKSPYLLQHAHNPVDWYPWGNEAFAKAKEEGKPIFLSIGYATCHWCHVMEHECFEDAEVAALMNRYFICIKVDREERPDIDAVYMQAARYLGSANGWPLTVVMTPDRKPYFAGTYIPKSPKFQIEGMLTLLPRLYQQVRYKSSIIKEAIARVERQIAPRPPREMPPPGAIEVDLDAACAALVSHVDPVYGGTGRGMKFPTSHQMLYLLEHARRTDNPDALAAVKLTLDNIRNGGIYDQVGFGVHRYAVDPVWFVPHFEKMLYNQAQLSLAAARYYALTGDESMRRMAQEIYTYVRRDLTAPGGAFYSAEDADSEGEEGRFYVWEYSELERILSKAELALFASVFAIERDGNWSDRSAEEQPTTNILRILPEGQKVLDGLDAKQRAQLETIRVRLLTVRSKRVRPLLDDKVLTDWNGLMIASMAEAGMLLQDQSLVASAQQAYAFVVANLYKEKRLLHRWRDGDAAIPGMLADHAFLAWGAIELYRATQELHYLADAASLMDRVITDFKDEQGGFNMISQHAEKLLFTPSDFGDKAIPSGNSVALLVLTELSRYTGVDRYEAARGSLYTLFAMSVPRGIDQLTFGAMAMERGQGESAEVVVVSPGDAALASAMTATVQAAAGKRTLYLHVKSKANAAALTELAPFTKEHKAIDGDVTAYVCKGFACQAPTSSPEKVKQLLEGSAP